jgi:hypothetical protein
MTLYEFNMLNDDEQLSTVWDRGIFLENHISKTEKINCYAIEMFFVEVVYDAKENKIRKVRSFKEGHLLDKYSPNFKTEI